MVRDKVFGGADEDRILAELVQTSSMVEMAMMYIALMVPLALTQSVIQA